jgi:hypothetical protein
MITVDKSIHIYCSRMLTQQDYNTHNHVKYLINYHFVFIPKRRKKVLTGEIATLNVADIR